MTKQHNDYYTYAYLREDKTPYYIGKGRGKRIYSKDRTIKAPKDKSRILFLKKGLTEAEAFRHEVYIIFVLGRKDLGTGILRNRTNGGEGSSGHVKSEETKKKISVANSGENNPMFGMTGEKNPMHGVPRAREWKQGHSKRMSGEKNSNYGNTGALSPCSIAIIVIKPDGTQQHFGGIREAARDLPINRRDLDKYLKESYVPKKGDWKGHQFLFKNPQGV